MYLYSIGLMMDAIMKDRLQRLKRASELIDSLLSSPPSTFIRQAEGNGCLIEFELLCEEVRQFLDDEAYLEDFAYELETSI
jgi:hypothetical protein